MLLVLRADGPAAQDGEHYRMAAPAAAGVDRTPRGVGRRRFGHDGLLGWCEFALKDSLEPSHAGIVELSSLYEICGHPAGTRAACGWRSQFRRVSSGDHKIRRGRFEPEAYGSRVYERNCALAEDQR